MSQIQEKYVTFKSNIKPGSGPSNFLTWPGILEAQCYSRLDETLIGSNYMLVFCLHLTFRQLEQACRRFCPRSIYTPHPPYAAGQPSFFLYFPTTALAGRNAVSEEIFSPRGGTGHLGRSSANREAASSVPRGLGF